MEVAKFMHTSMPARVAPLMRSPRSPCSMKSANGRAHTRVLLRKVESSATSVNPPVMRWRPRAKFAGSLHAMLSGGGGLGAFLRCRPGPRQEPLGGFGCSSGDGSFASGAAVGGGGCLVVVMAIVGAVRESGGAASGGGGSSGESGAEWHWRTPRNASASPVAMTRTMTGIRQERRRTVAAAGLRCRRRRFFPSSRMLGISSYVGVLVIEV